MTDEDADAGFPISNVQLLRVLLLHGEGTPGLRYDPRGAGHRPTGLSHRLRNILGTLKGTTGIDPWPRSGNRGQGIRLAEPVSINLHPYPLG